MKELKTRKREEQNGKCALSGVYLPEETWRFDADCIPEDDIQAVEPVAHMAKHGNLRVRTEFEEEMGSNIAARCHLMRLVNRISNQLEACERQTDKHLDEVIEFLQEDRKGVKRKLNQFDYRLKKQVKELAKTDKLVATALCVPGTAEVTVAGLYYYIDLAKARHASSVWKYVGLDVPSWQRYQKGKKGGGNRNLRTILYAWGDSQIRLATLYSQIYYNTKHRYEHSSRLVWTHVKGKKGVHQKPWKDVAPSHRHGAAIRKMIKIFLAHYWMVGRRLHGFPTSSLWIEEHGEEHRIIPPHEMGWPCD